MSETEEEPRCGYCGMVDGKWGRHLILKPVSYMGPMHRECLADIARWGCD
jgi:hypothetical protein